MPSNMSAHQRASSIAFAPFAAIGWFFLALLGLAVRVALFRRLRGEGAVSLLWGLGFALFLWFGLWSIKVQQLNAILFALVAGLAIALFVYLRGAGLESPPLERPGVFHRRALARRRARRASPVPHRPPPTGEIRELRQARIELGRGEPDAGLYSLREAERVAVAQRKLRELLEIRELAGSVSERSRDRTREAGERLARRVAEEIDAFPAGELAAVGIHREPDRDPLAVILARPVPVAEQALTPTRELVQARLALDAGELGAALFLLEEACRVAVAQRRLGELVETYRLVQALAERTSGRLHTKSEQLARTVESGLRSFAA